MKIAINKCFGGFSLSPKAVKRLAELQGRECYFFRDYPEYTPVSDPSNNMMWTAVDTLDFPERYAEAKEKDKGTGRYDNGNAFYEAHTHSQRPSNRNDPNLIQVIEELGDEANGMCAKLGITEIPDGIDYKIEDYDGSEHVAEAHRTWS
jgi:hypothetical protein